MDPAGTPELEHLMLMRYKAWMMDITCEALWAVPEVELRKERPTTFRTILSTLNHIYVVDDIFKAHLTGEGHGYSARNTEMTPSLSQLRRASDDLARWYIQFADAQTGRELAKTVEFEFVGGGQGAMTRGQILHHIVNHTTYHIGYVSDMMYQIPVEPPATDLPVYLRDVHPV